MPIFASLRIDCRIGRNKARLISLRFDSPTLCLNTYAPNGSLNVRQGCVFIRNRGAPTWSANIMNGFQARSSVGSMLATARAFCDDMIALRSWLRRCATSMVNGAAIISSVVMPSHVHALVVQNADWPLEKLLRSWKSFTSRKINSVPGRKGSLWQRDYFDRLVRDEKHFANCVRYIRTNPERAHLQIGEYTLYESELARSIE